MSTTDLAAAPAVAANIEAEFERTGLTNDEVARRLEVPERNVRRWRKGETTPRWNMLVRLAEVFDRLPHWFYVPRDADGQPIADTADAA